MRAKRQIEQHYQAGTLPQNAASVVFKVCSKAAGNRLLVEMWVAGVKFRALPFIADRADSLCARCSRWGHSEFCCHWGGTLVCAICAGTHRTEGHKCEVATCGREGKICSHTAMKCPNCSGNHPAQDARCKAKGAAITMARGERSGSRGVRSEGPSRAPLPETRSEQKHPRAPPPQRHTANTDAARSSGSTGPLSWVPGADPQPEQRAIQGLNAAGNPVTHEWVDDCDTMDIEVGSSGTAQPIAI